MRITIALLLTLLVSCKEISFKEPQPKGRKALSEIPKTLWGKYLTYQENGDLAKDTIIISARGYRIAYFEPSGEASEYDKGVLSDSLIIKNYKGYYFMNLHEKPEWLLRVLKPEKNGDIIYMAPEQEGVDFKDYIKKLSGEIRIDSIQVQDKMLYQIDPSPNELVKLIEKGFFNRATLKKIK
jgi:hypothetical protein